MGDGLIRSLGDSLDVREFQQGFTEDLLNIYMISTEDLPKIKTYSRFAKDLLKIYPKSTQDLLRLPNTYPELNEDLPKIGHLPSKFFPRITKDIPNIY